jgi:GTP-binding protein
MSIVAIVGRPNVGKSTIFNILTGSKSAIVADFSGLTRDRQYGNLKNSNITLIDTGGLNEASDDMSRAIKKQTDLAIAEADMLLFVVDALDGMLPMDKDLAQNIRKQDKKTILLINKADNSKLEESSSEFNSFGFQDVICLSASHNKGFSELRDYLIDSETIDDYLTEESDPSLKISIIGRPNAGKSTLINALIGEDRLVVSSKSGTTRDSIEVPINMGNKKLTLIDTAGMRRKRSIKELTEKFSVSKSVESIKRADVVIILT